MPTVLCIVSTFIAAIAAMASAQDYIDSPPPARGFNLQRLNSLASRMDKLLQPFLPRNFIDGSVLRGMSPKPAATAMDASEAIGVRSYFEEQPAPATQPRNQVRPLHVMRDNELGPPLPPTQWQLMVSPFVMLLPDITDYCQCRGMANCGCCMGFMIKPLGIRNNLCLNASMTKDASSTSQYMMHVRLHFDTYKIVDISVSEKQPPMVCVSIVPFSTVAGCLQLADIYRDAMEEKVCSCSAISIQFKDRPVMTIPSGCFCVGKPVPDSKKRGLFGLDFGALFSILQDMLFG